MILPAALTLQIDTITAALLCVTLINAGLALVVVRAARREENRVFALLAASVATWTLTNALFRTVSSSAAATLWAQFSYIAALGTAAAFLHFALIYPRLPSVTANARRLSLQLAGWLCGATVMASVFIPKFVIEGVDVPAQHILTGPGIGLIALYMLVVSATAFAFFFGHQKRLRQRARAQARYVLFGSFLTAVFGLTFNLAFPLAGDYRFVWLGPLASLFFVGFSSYSIVAHHLFDVRLLIRRTLVYALLLALLAGAFAALENGLEYLLRPFLGGSEGFSTDLMAALVVGFGVDPLKRRLHKIVAKMLFHGEPPDGENQE